MEPTEQLNVKFYTWAEMHVLCKTLATKVEAITSNDSVIVGIARGGFFPALILSHELKCRSLFSINVRTTSNDSIRALRTTPEAVDLRELPVAGKRVLLVDDVTNSGTTLLFARKLVAEFDPREIITLCPVWDTVSERGREPVSACAADYVVETIHAWARFPWEVATD